MKKMTKSMTLLVMWAAVVSCNEQRRDQAPLRIGFSYFQDTMLPLVAEWQGWYEEAGLDVELVSLEWSAIPAALASGQVDVAIANECAVIGVHHREPNMRYLYGFNTFDNGFALMVRPNSGFRTVADFEKDGMPRADAVRRAAAQLRGKVVVTTSGTDMEQGVAAAAKRGGLVFGTDAKIRDLDPEAGLEAFLSGVGDAYIGGIPQRLAATQRGMIEMLTGNDLGPAPINGYIALDRTYRERNREILALLQLWFRTVQAVEADSTLAMRVVSELNQHTGGKFTLAEFRSFFNNVEHYPPDPMSVRRSVVDSTGNNYWVRRWESCNDYYAEIVPSNSPLRIPRRVPLQASLVPEVQQAVESRFGSIIRFYPDSALSSAAAPEWLK